MTKLIITAIIAAFISGYFTGTYIESNDKQQVIIELATVIYIANRGFGGYIDND